MTEKRFTLTNPKNLFQEMKCGIDDRGITLTFNEVVTLLNNLSDEKQELKKEKNKWIIDYNGLSTEYEWLKEENEQLKQENSIFEGKDAKHYQRWVTQIKKYVEEDNPDFTYDEDFIIKIALSYTLQSLRNGESLKRFQWNYKELEE